MQYRLGLNGGGISARRCSGCHHCFKMACSEALTPTILRLNTSTLLLIQEPKKNQRYTFFFQPKLVNWLFVFHHSTHLPYLSLKLLEKNPRTCISLPNTPRPSGYPGDRPKDECTRWFTVGFQHSISLVGLDTFMHCGLPVGSPRDS